MKFFVDIINKVTGKVITTTTVRGGGIDTVEKAVEHVQQTHPRHKVKASAKQPSETQAALDAAKKAAEEAAAAEQAHQVAEHEGMPPTPDRAEQPAEAK